MAPASVAASGDPPIWRVTRHYKIIVLLLKPSNALGMLNSTVRYNLFIFCLLVSVSS